MITKALNKLKSISPWHFIWISVLFSELITFCMNYLQGYLYWGKVSKETLIIGAVDAMIVPLIVATVAIYFVKQITELRKCNEQLQETNRKLELIDKRKTDFMSVVSHELRTPLTTIKAFVELIMMKPGMPEQRKTKLMGTIDVEADRLTRLIADLLDLARIESGSMKWRTEELVIEEIIQNTVVCMGPLVEKKGICLTMSIDSSPLRLSGDRDRLMQVVTNILANAVKYTPAGGAIHVATRREAAPVEQVIVEVTDTGMGIPAGDLELIFEKFQRSDNELTTSIEGTGLGLAIARQIVERHGGRIWATSMQGKGSTFTFALPPAGSAELFI